MPFVTSQKADFRKLSVSVQPAEGATEFFSEKTLMIVMMLSGKSGVAGLREAAAGPSLS